VQLFQPTKMSTVMESDSSPRAPLSDTVSHMAKSAAICDLKIEVPVLLHTAPGQNKWRAVAHEQTALDDNKSQSFASGAFVAGMLRVSLTEHPCMEVANATPARLRCRCRHGRAYTLHLAGKNELVN
jgi:hypothetical protein